MEQEQYWLLFPDLLIICESSNAGEVHGIRRERGGRERGRERERERESALKAFESFFDLFDSLSFPLFRRGRGRGPFKVEAPANPTTSSQRYT
jgi:hypothetical protein